MGGGVYEVLNIPEQRRYIGAAVDLERRLDRHIRELRGGYHNCKQMQDDFNRLGEDAFELAILERVPVDPGRHWDEQELRLAKQRHLNTTENTYNLRNVRMEPLNDIGSHAWVREMRGYIDASGANPVRVPLMIGARVPEKKPKPYRRRRDGARGRAHERGGIPVWGGRDFLDLPPSTWLPIRGYFMEIKGRRYYVGCILCSCLFGICFLGDV